MVWDIFAHALALDLPWLIETALANIFFIFALFAVSFIFFEGKRPLRAFLHVALAPLFFFALIPFIGWSDVTGYFIAFYYVIELSMLKFAETMPFFAKRLVWVEEAVFFGSVIVFNLFIA